MIQDFSLPSTKGTFNLNDYRGKYLVLYFYPKDNTPGCTMEGNDFRDLYAKFQAANTEVFGISADSLESHDKFKCQQEFPFELLSDKDKIARKIFDVSFIGRATFIIDPTGNLIKEWRNVTVAGHTQEVLDFICTTSKS